MIYPDSFQLFEVIENKTHYAKIYLYNESKHIFSGKIQDITPERFERLNRLLEELIKINNSDGSLIFGIVEIQELMEELK